MQRTTIHLADPSPYGRIGLAQLLERCSQACLAGIADSVAALTLDRDHILVAHFRAFGSAPIPTIGRICREGLARAIVVVVDSVDYAPEILDAGVAALLTRDDDAAMLHRAIEAAATGRTFRSPDVAEYCDQHRQLMEDFDLCSAAARTGQAFLHGIGRHDIATDLDMSYRTVGNHVSILRKITGCYEPIQIAAWIARRYGVPANGIAFGCPNCIAAQASQDAVLELPAPDLVLELPARDNVVEVGAPEINPTDAAPVAVELTPEQHELVQLHRSGYTSAAIAKERDVHPSTVRRRMQNIRDRVGCATNADLFVWYAEQYDAVLELPARDAVLQLPAADMVLDLTPADAVVVSQPVVAPAQVRPARRHAQPLRWLGAAPADRSRRAASHAQAHEQRPVQWHGAVPVSAHSFSDHPSARPLAPLARAASTLAQARAAPRLTHGIAPPSAAERWGGLPCVR